MTQDVLAEAIGSVELGFWRETPIEDPDGVHGIEARFDVRAFAEAITAALDIRGYALVRTPETLDATPQILRDLIEATWGGYIRPADDAGILNAIADWLDRLDDVADGVAHKPIVSRAMQDDLRRIASSLPAATDPADGLDEAFRPLLSWAEACSQHYAMLRTEPPFTTTQALKEALASAYAALVRTPETLDGAEARADIEPVRLLRDLCSPEWHDCTCDVHEAARYWLAGGRVKP